MVKVRAPRERADDTEGDGVQSVRGSTRLEAKRQRRRDGRDAGRRRVPILSEAEFLARREAVERSMVVRERGDLVCEPGHAVEARVDRAVGAPMAEQVDGDDSVAASRQLRAQPLVHAPVHEQPVHEDDHAITLAVDVVGDPMP